MHITSLRTPVLLIALMASAGFASAQMTETGRGDLTTMKGGQANPPDKSVRMSDTTRAEVKAGAAMENKNVNRSPTGTGNTAASPAPGAAQNLPPVENAGATKKKM